jgi:integrase
VKKEPYVPSDEDVKRIIEESKGTQYEVPIRLACYGLRKSEICALTIDDLNGNILTINKALVLNEDLNWVIKTTKNEASTREIYIDDGLVALINDKGFYHGYPGNINKWLNRTEEKLGIEHFSLHKLRHYYASMAHSLGIPDAYIMKAGGWKTDNVMKRVYRHAQKDKSIDAMKDVASHIAKLN